jgi:hypothetical protein
MSAMPPLIAILARAEPLQPGLAGMDGHAPHARRLHGGDEAGQHLGRLLIVDADAALDGDFHRADRLHLGHAVRDEARRLHQHGAEAARLDAVARAADI